MPSDPGGLVVRRQSAAAPPVAMIVPRARTAGPSSQRTPTTRPSSSHRSAARVVSSTRTPGCATRTAESCAHDAAPGRAPARVHDAPARVAALEAEREVAVAVGVEDDADALQREDHLGRLVRQHLGGRAADQPAARALGVLEVQLRRVVDRERRGEPALRPVARRLRERRGADDGDARAGLGGRQRRVEPGGAGADDRDVRVDPLGGAHARVPYPSVRPLILRHDASLRHDTGPHPERIARMDGDRAGARAARDWLGYERARLGAGDGASSSTRSTRPATGRRSPPRAPRAAGRSTPTRSSRPARCEAALHAAGGAAEVVDVLLAGEAPVAASLHRPPGHHAEAGRAMGFCLFNNVAVAARHAIDAHGLERVLILDWDVHHGNGTNDIFHADPRVLFVSIHQSPLYPGKRRRDRPRVGRRARVHGEPAGPRRQRRRRLPRARRARRRARRAGRTRRSSCSLGRVRRARDDPLAGCTRDRGGLRGDGRERAAPGRRARRAGRPRARGRLRPDGARGLARRDARDARARPGGAAGASRPRRIRSPTRRRRVLAAA